MQIGGRLIFYKKTNDFSSTQSWIPIIRISENGIIQLENKYIKIVKIIPVNFNLKSELEKETILNSYKIFFKTCNFDMQILIQSKKEDLSKHISCIESQKNKEEKEIQIISQNYINYINNLNEKRKSSTKNFYIIFEYKSINKDVEKIDSIICEELNEKYLKIKDCLSRCGNLVININKKEEIKKILFSCLNSTKNIYEQEVV